MRNLIWTVSLKLCATSWNMSEAKFDDFLNIDIQGHNTVEWKLEEIEITAFHMHFSVDIKHSEFKAFREWLLVFFTRWW